VIVASGT